MNLLKNYDIDISKLNLGHHEFHFQIEDEFFELFDYSLIDHGSLEAVILLEKKTTFISVGFQVSGNVELTCDRSLEKYEHDLSIENSMVFKYGDEAKIVSDEIEIITPGTHKINVGSYLYEFVSVAIPMKKLHPRYADESEENQIIFSSKDEENNAEVDPRWSELKKLKNKK